MEKIRMMYVLLSALMIVVSLPLIARKVPPNHFYGFRWPGTLRDPEIWYEVNAFGGKLMLVLGVCLSLVSFLLPRLPGITLDGYAMAFTGMLLAALGTITVLSVLYYRRLKTQRDGE